MSNEVTGFCSALLILFSFFLIKWDQILLPDFYWLQTDVLSLFKKQFYYFFGDKGLNLEVAFLRIFSLLTFFLDKKSNNNPDSHRDKTVRSGIFRSWEIAADEPSPDAQNFTLFGTQKLSDTLAF